MANNPKTVALLQALFYGFITVATPMLIAALGAGGALNGMFSPGVTIVLLWVLNAVDNQLNAKTGGSFFGVIS